MAKKTESADMLPNFEVVKPFRDAAKHLNDGEKVRRYSIGEDVSHFDAKRLEGLIKRGLVKENKLND